MAFARRRTKLIRKHYEGADEQSHEATDPGLREARKARYLRQRLALIHVFTIRILYFND